MAVMFGSVFIGSVCNLVAAQIQTHNARTRDLFFFCVRGRGFLLDVHGHTNALSLGRLPELEMVCSNQLMLFFTFQASLLLNG